MLLSAGIATSIATAVFCSLSKHHYVWLAGQQLLVCLELESFVILHHFQQCLPLGLGGFKPPLGTNVCVHCPHYCLCLPVYAVSACILHPATTMQSQGQICTAYIFVLSALCCHDQSLCASPQANWWDLLMPASLSLSLIYEYGESDDMMK